MRRRGLSSDQVDDAIHLYNLGWPLARVGEHLNVDHTTVLTKLRKHGIPTRDARTTTIMNGAVRSTVDAVGRPLWPGPED